uniref:Putative secreted protein n=1 Tax=Anopheles darlingi TaxID=43151 RepID=A0A2M4DCM5_ANODA
MITSPYWSMNLLHCLLIVAGNLLQTLRTAFLMVSRVFLSASSDSSLTMTNSQRAHCGGSDPCTLPSLRTRNGVLRTSIGGSTIAGSMM